MPSFSANYAFQSPENIRDNLEQGGTLVFEALDRMTALDDFRRWWIGRNAAVPEHFHRLVCVKMSDWSIGNIAVDGICRTGALYPWYEWKIDTLGRGLGPIHFLEPERVGW